MVDGTDVIVGDVRFARTDGVVYTIDCPEFVVERMVLVVVVNECGLLCNRCIDTRVVKSETRVMDAQATFPFHLVFP